MMKWLIVFAALAPLSGVANMLNTSSEPIYTPGTQHMLNNSTEPNQPGYNPSTSRVKEHMLNQQSQQQQKLQQDQQRQSQDLQRKVQERRDSAAQHVVKPQTGSNYQPPVQNNNQQ